MTTQTIIHLVWIPMFVIGALVFGVGMFFFARLLAKVRIPFAGRKPLARFGRTKMAATAVGSASGLALVVLAMAPGTAPVHSAIGNALSKIPAVVGHPLDPGTPEAAPPAPPPAPPASPAAVAAAPVPASHAPSPGSSSPVLPPPVPTPPVSAPTPPPAPEPTPPPTPEPPPPPTPEPTPPAPDPTGTPPAPDPAGTPAPDPAVTAGQASEAIS